MGRIQDKTFSIFKDLKNIVKTDSKAYWILFKFAPELLPRKSKTYKELQDNYVCFAKFDEEYCENYIYQEDVQSAVKWLLKRKYTADMIDMYQKYLEKAKNDTRALKDFMMLKDEFFKDENANELLNILQGIDVDTTDDTDDYEMHM